MQNISETPVANLNIGVWASPLLDELRRFRRDLHQHPELSHKEFLTTEKLAARLVAAGLEPRLLEGTGLFVDIGEGPLAIGLRADIDALPILEETGLE